MDNIINGVYRLSITLTIDGVSARELFTKAAEIADIVEHKVDRLDISTETEEIRNASVRLTYTGEKKIQCIKEVRNITKWGLKESKYFVEGQPVTMPFTDANRLKGALTLLDGDCRVDIVPVE